MDTKEQSPNATTMSTTTAHSREDELTSKGLSRLLRTSAPDHNITLDSNGYTDLDQVLALKRFKNISIADIKRIVKNSDKQRYSLRNHPETGKLQIRANQGHTLPNVNLDLQLINEDNIKDFGFVVHGTNALGWNTSIRFEGLNRVDRHHIHFGHGQPSEQGVVPGVRVRTTIHIYLNLTQAFHDGFKFFLSQNSVILSPGNERGQIPAKYFSKVLDLDKGLERTDFMTDDFNREDHQVTELPDVLMHATLQKHVNEVRWTGLKNAMGPYVNFVSKEPPSGSVAEVLFFLDVAKARSEGLKMYQFEKGGQFLCSEVLDKSYFVRLKDTRNGRDMAWR